MRKHSVVLKGLGFSILALLATGSFGSAQTSGTLNTQIGQSWSTAPWVITAGPGLYPDAGGAATFSSS